MNGKMRQRSKSVCVSKAGKDQFEDKLYSENDKNSSDEDSSDNESFFHNITSKTEKNDYSNLFKLNYF